MLWPNCSFGVVIRPAARDCASAATAVNTSRTARHQPIRIDSRAPALVTIATPGKNPTITRSLRSRAAFFQAAHGDLLHTHTGAARGARDPGRGDSRPTAHAGR